MSAAMRLACLLGTRCEVHRPDGVVNLPGEFDAEEDTLLIVDADEAITQIVRLAGDPKHAPALAARHVRQQGLMEGEASVVAHASFRRGGEYELLFTAYPAARWKALQAWASAQPHAVAVVPVMSLLWHSLTPGTGLIYRSGSRFTFVANLGGAPVLFATQAFSEEVSDLSATAGILADGILAQLGQSSAGAGGIAALSRIDWVSRLASGQVAAEVDKEVIARVEAQLQAKVSLQAHQPLRGTSAGSMSGLGYLAQAYRPALAVCSSGTRAALLARHHLRAAAWVSMAAAVLASVGVAGFWASTLSLRSTASQTADEAARIEALVQQRAASEAMPPLFDETRALVERLGSFAGSPDLTQILGALRAAGGSGVRVLRVYTVADKSAGGRATPAGGAGAAPASVTAPRIQIDATVDATAQRSEAESLSDFVALLRKQGFVVAEVEGQTRGALSNGRTVFSYQLKSMRNEAQGRVPR